LQGPHHSAQRSTSTSFSESITSLPKAALVTSMTLLIPSLTWCGQEMFRVDSRAAARTSIGNRLSVVVINEVTACEYAVNISARGRLINYDIAFFVGGNLAAEEL